MNPPRDNTDCAKALEWSADRIEVINDDLGQSGSSGVHRDGFQRLLAEVSNNAVGLVPGLEMSRLARSCMTKSKSLSALITAPNVANCSGDHPTA